MAEFAPWPPVSLQPLARSEAARAFEAAAIADPEGIATPSSMAAAGQCFKLEGKQGQLVISVGGERGVFWCYAAAGSGHRMYLAADAVLCRLAKLSGYLKVGFQTVRPGLVRRAVSLGYRVTEARGCGFAMEKNLV